MVEFFEKLKSTLPERKFKSIITNPAQVNFKNIFLKYKLRNLNTNITICFCS